MGITNSNKTLSATKIPCGGSFKIKLSLSAEPDITANPADIVLILDRSASMSGQPLESLKGGAKKFIDIIARATDPGNTGELGCGSRIGIVSFATTATKDLPLSTSVAALEAAVDALSAGGNTNQADAFTMALELFEPLSSNVKVMVMFTDGVSTAGPDPTPVAVAAKAQGVIIYCIGLDGNGGVDLPALTDWASTPASTYVAVAPSDDKLEDIFENLAMTLVKPGATNIVIDERLNPCFEIAEVLAPGLGTAHLVNSGGMQWKIPVLGAVTPETATFEFTVRHIGPCSGLVFANEAINYSDSENHMVTFPTPQIEVECGTVVVTEPCPTPVEVEISGCSDSLEFTVDDVELQAPGRILQVDLTVKNVCPNKRMAVAVALTELDPAGLEYQRGLKTFTVPAHDSPTCRDVSVRCVKFVLPEDLSVSGGTTSALCGSRRFNIRVISNYIDTDFVCCGIIT